MGVRGFFDSVSTASEIMMNTWFVSVSYIPFCYIPFILSFLLYI